MKHTYKNLIYQNASGASISILGKTGDLIKTKINEKMLIQFNKYDIKNKRLGKNVSVSS
jgi:hypothetical protein